MIQVLVILAGSALAGYFLSQKKNYRHVVALLSNGGLEVTEAMRQVDAFFKTIAPEAGVEILDPAKRAYNSPKSLAYSGQQFTLPSGVIFDVLDVSERDAT